jgi:acyl carrier protein
MTPEDVLANVLAVARSEIHEDTSNRTVAEWDSLAHVTLILELERIYSVSFSMEDALTLTDLASIKRVLRERGAQW